jgi:HD-GYP domain-containing protein (c-di-GMP phosphodiesterase class II)
VDAVFDRDVPRRVLLRFGIVCALALALAGGTILYFVRADARKAAEANEAFHTSFVSDTILRDNLAASDMVAPPSGARLDDLDVLFRREIIRRGALRAKLYSRNGLVVYSNDHTLIGTRTDDLDETKEVLAGNVVHDVSWLNHEGGTGKDVKVLESYVPLRLPGSNRPVGVFELYEDYGPVASEVSDVSRDVSIAVVVALLLLYLGLFPVLRRVTGALARRNRGLAERTRELTEALRLLRDSQEDLASSREETIRRLSVAAEYRDADTGEHIERMSSFAAVLARELGLDEETVELIRIAAPLHDVGKIATPDAILLKPGPLTQEERRAMEEHARIGSDMLAGSTSELLQLAAEIARTHHEKVDGSGYPDGLRGEEIPLVGRIAAIADVFDALTSDRVYRPAMSVEEALEIMREGRGTHFDEEVFAVFERCLDQILAIRARQLSEPAAA